ncbi:MAG: MaoC family dehydratase N-terminal domain-containing protein [Azospirillaceae bacterium]
MSNIPEGAMDYIGMRTSEEFACEPVEPGAVRRYAQAIMDEAPIFAPDAGTDNRFGGPVAPPLFPQAMFRRAYGDPDPVQENAYNEDFDGSSGNRTLALPEIRQFRGFGVLNGGSEIEFYRYARYGERVKVTSFYEDIVEKQSSKGPIILIYIVSDYFTADDELLLRIRRISIRRPLK